MFMKKYLFLMVVLFFAHAVTNAQIKVITPERPMIAQLKDNSKPVAFRLFNYSGLSLPSSGATVLNVSVKEFDLSNNTRGNTFVAPDNGVYHFDVRLNFSFPITDYANFLRFHLSLLKGSQTIEKTTIMNAQTAFSPDHTLMISTTLALMKGDVISASFNTDANPGTNAVNGSSASFSGFKVADMHNVQNTDIIR
jgi:hypothetical protein